MIITLTSINHYRFSHGDYYSFIAIDITTTSNDTYIHSGASPLGGVGSTVDTVYTLYVGFFAGDDLSIELFNQDRQSLAKSDSFHIV
jgi:hypothetical protein